MRKRKPKVVMVSYQISSNESKPFYYSMRLDVLTQQNNIVNIIEKVRGESLKDFAEQVIKTTIRAGFSVTCVRDFGAILLDNVIFYHFNSLSNTCTPSKIFISEEQYKKLRKGGGLCLKS